MEVECCTYSPFYRYLETPNFVLHGSQGGIVKFLFFNQTTKATTKIVKHTYASYNAVPTKLTRLYNFLTAVYAIY